MTEPVSEDVTLPEADAPSHDAELAWRRVVRMRLDDLRSGKVEPVSGEAVFERIRRLYGK